MEEQEKEMSFLDHLEIFRWHLIRSAGAIMFFAIIAFIFKEIVFDIILVKRGRIKNSNKKNTRSTNLYVHLLIKVSILKHNPGAR